MELNRDLIIPLCFYHDVQVCAGWSWIVEYIKATIHAKLRRSIPFLGGSAWRNVYRLRDLLLYCPKWTGFWTDRRVKSSATMKCLDAYRASIIYYYVELQIKSQYHLCIRYQLVAKRPEHARARDQAFISATCLLIKQSYMYPFPLERHR